MTASWQTSLTRTVKKNVEMTIKLNQRYYLFVYTTELVSHIFVMALMETFLHILSMENNNEDIIK